MAGFEARQAAQNHMAVAEQVLEAIPSESEDRLPARVLIESASAIVAGLVYVGDAIVEATARLPVRGSVEDAFRGDEREEGDRGGE